jgi:hypothetical protein
MKGTIVVCLKDLVTAKLGPAKWKQSLAQAGLEDSMTFTVLDDVPDQQVFGLMKSAAAVMSLSTPQFMDAFGEHWSTIYAPQVYSAYFGGPKVRANCC